MSHGGDKAYKRKHRLWMRRWRQNEENRKHEQALFQLRHGLREGIVSEESYWQEVWHPWKVRVLKP